MARPTDITSHQYAKLRLLVLARDAWQCQLQLEGCDGRADHVDHIRPMVQGGLTTYQNLQAACGRCNRAKGSFLSPRGGLRTPVPKIPPLIGGMTAHRQAGPNRRPRFG
jgi:5-methylcytosine-specific restriction endonuclease McrA